VVSIHGVRSISGLSLCLLLRTNDVALAIVAAIVAVSSKFLLKVNGKHLFNPTNIAIVALMAATGRCVGIARSVGECRIFRIPDGVSRWACREPRQSQRRDLRVHRVLHGACVRPIDLAGRAADESRSIALKTARCSSSRFS
jgi:hypothetical protein